MNNDLRRRISRLEDRGLASAREARGESARHARRMASIQAFIDAAWPDRSESLAHHVAVIIGLPHDRALRHVLAGTAVQDVAERTYGVAWRKMMEVAAADAAQACAQAHGPDWEVRLVEIWRTH